MPRKKPVQICDRCEGGPTWEDHTRNEGNLTKKGKYLEDGTRIVQHLCSTCLVGADLFDPENEHVMHSATDQIIQSSWMPESVQSGPKDQFLNAADKRQLHAKMVEMGLAQTRKQISDAHWYRLDAVVMT